MKFVMHTFHNSYIFWRAKKSSQFEKFPSQIVGFGFENLRFRIGNSLKLGFKNICTQYLLLVR